MTNETILKKAIEKAVKNGWETTWILPNGNAIYSVIFSLDFAKAFWGEELLCYDCGEKVGKPLGNERIQIGTGTCTCQRQFENNEEAWEFHLQMMVTEENPIKYLEQFLDEQETKKDKMVD